MVFSNHIQHVLIEVQEGSALWTDIINRPAEQVGCTLLILMDQSTDKYEVRVARKYRLGEKIGSGAFGEIYEGINVDTNEEVAIKMEPVRSRQPQLMYEYKIYRVLQGGGEYDNGGHFSSGRCVDLMFIYLM